MEIQGPKRAQKQYLTSKDLVRFDPKQNLGMLHEQCAVVEEEKTARGADE